MGRERSVAQSSPAAPDPYRLLIGVILVVVAALIMVLVYTTVSGPYHVAALLWIGVIALLFALVAYIARSLRASFTTASLWSWGFAAFGFAVLFGTLGVNPHGTLSSADQILGLILTLVTLAIVVAGTGWQARAKAATAQRETERTAWASKPAVSALDYPAAAGPTSPPAPAPEEVRRA